MVLSSCVNYLKGTLVAIFQAMLLDPLLLNSVPIATHSPKSIVFQFIDQMSVERETIEACYSFWDSIYMGMAVAAIHFVDGVCVMQKKPMRSTDASISRTRKCFDRPLQIYLN